MDGIGGAIARVFAIIIFVAFILGVIFVGAIWGGISYMSSDEIESKTLLKPHRIEVISNGKTSDTTYFYKKPKT